MLQDREVPIDQFIKITSGGIKIADYDQIQTALINAYKEVYGSDIDLANTTADGVYINNLALIINNILQSFKILYSNLDVNTASGVYLDSLCRLANITRKRATQSIAQLSLTSTLDVILNSGTKFVDYTGNTWTYNGPTWSFDLANTTWTSSTGTVINDANLPISVTCDSYGAIVASAGSIYQTLEYSTITVSQPTAANVGLEDETDSELRARRAQSTGATGTTVLESLVGALLDVLGIEDVQVINNNTTVTSRQNDGTDVGPHDVYVVIRRSQPVEDSTIGSIIYNKLTPGIRTIQTADSTTGVSKNYVAILDENINWINQNIYWKEAVPIHPTCSVTITPLTFYNESTANLIGNKVIDYLNKLKINNAPTNNDMLVAAMFADPKFKGAPTYIVKSVSLPSATNTNTYYDYDKATATASGDDIVITFSKEA